MTSIKIYFSLLNIRELYFTVLVEHVFNYGRKKVWKELGDANSGIPVKFGQYKSFLAFVTSKQKFEYFKVEYSCTRIIRKY